MLLTHTLVGSSTLTFFKTPFTLFAVFNFFSSSLFIPFLVRLLFPFCARNFSALQTSFLWLYSMGASAASRWWFRRTSRGLQLKLACRSFFFDSEATLVWWRSLTRQPSMINKLEDGGVDRVGLSTMTRSCIIPDDFYGQVAGEAVGGSVSRKEWISLHPLWLSSHPPPTSWKH